MSERNLNVLASPGFLAGLSLLLVNDFVLKQQFHNGLTGKLSDFAGLFVFPLFCAAFCPRLRPHVYALTAASFVFWKSASSQPVIDAWNSLRLFHVGRTIDPGDLCALLSLPASYAYGRSLPKSYSPRPVVCSIALVSLFAFTATQFSKITTFDDEYQFQISKKELLTRMSRLPQYDVLASFWEDGPDAFVVEFDSCNGRATIDVREAGGASVAALKSMDYRCPGGGVKDEMRRYFEQEFVGQLRQEGAGKSPQVISIRRAPDR